MTDNEIVKALEKWCDNNCKKVCPHLKICDECVVTYIKSALDLINRQKAEIEMLKNKQKPTGASGYKIENGKVVFFTNMLGGYRQEYENLDEVVKTLNELLQEAYSKDEILFYYKRAIEDLKTAKTEAIKEFAERLKASQIITHRSKEGFCVYEFDDELIDNLVEEMTEDGK